MRIVAAPSSGRAAASPARQAGEDLDTASNFSFPVMGWDSVIVKKELNNLQWTYTYTGWKR